MYLDLPDTWADQEVLLLAEAQCRTFIDAKISEARKEGIEDSRIFKSQSKDISLTELIGLDMCSLSERRDLAKLVSMNQAFQAYSVSLYDMIKDNHLVRFGEPTFLELYGKDEVQNVESAYNNIFNRISKTLEEKGVPNATKISSNQYLETLRLDLIRGEDGAKKDINKAIYVQEGIAGMRTAKIALLANSPGALEFLGFYLGNALSTIDNLIDFFGEDLENPKLTIPITYFENEFGLIKEKTIQEVRERFLDSKTIEKTKEYIYRNLRKAKFLLEDFSGSEKTLIHKMTEKMIGFLDGFPKRHAI